MARPLPALGAIVSDRPSPGTPAILAEGVRRAFGEVVALDGVDLVVEAGSVFGLLGPNGAGKTTTVSILATLLSADGGEVLGHLLVPREGLARVQPRYV